MTQYLETRKGPILLGSMAMAFMELMESPHDLIFVGHDINCRLNEIEKQSPPDQRVCYDEQGPWPPVPVDPIVAKHRDIRIAKAEAKRARKKLKRLGLIQFPMTGLGYEQAKKFMIAIGQYESFLTNGQSIDGYTLVAWANSELDK